MRKDLLSDFENATEKQWLEKIEADLKGKPLNSLFWHSEIGEINPVIFQTENITEDNFKRGNANNWSIRQSFDASITTTNQQILLALKGGVNAIEIKNLNAENIDSTLKDVMLNIIDIHIDINNSTPLKSIETFANYCKTKNIDTKELNGGFKYDPIKNYVEKGNWFINKEADLGNIEKIIEVSEVFENFSILSIDSDIYCDSGANINTQISLALAHANEYLNFYNDNTALLEKIIQKTEFTFGIGSSYFLEIAKLRAFRSLWSVIANQYVATDTLEAKIHCVNSNLYYSNKDKYTNLLRATTAGMSAVIAGCNSVTLLPFNQNVDKNKDFALRLAKNIQLILQEESYFKQVKDASKGAYYIENLIQSLKENCWNQFLEIEKQEGFLACLNSNFIQTKIESEFTEKETALKEDRKIMIGVNKFINSSEESANPIKKGDLPQDTLINPIKTRRLATAYE